MRDLPKYVARWIINCTKCGRETDLYLYRFRYAMFFDMVDRKLCYKCMYWTYLVEKPPEDMQVIDGVLLIWHNSPNPCDTRTKYIYTNDGKALSSCKYRVIGKVPEQFRENFPDTARYISKKTYHILIRNRSIVCRKKGCWDRKTCFWYHDPEMNWNKIPDSHKPGDEQCRDYLDISKI